MQNRYDEKLPNTSIIQRCPDIYALTALRRVTSCNMKGVVTQNVGLASR